ncbi:MAG: hypothetical protein JWP88_2108 [Flaviaesturariibacter sp.]|nr:hypothetical protein [Flaviaesturariibacter sp.]
MEGQAGKMLLVLGGVIIIIGLIVYFGGNHLRWLGRLPGDIRVERENFRFYFPVVTMLLLSLVVTIVINLLRRWF